MNQLPINQFLNKLSTQSPVPGGGGASALIGAISAALCSMVASLTSGKKKYVEYQEDIDRILKETSESINNLQELINKDAEVFEPLSKAYSIPKDDPDRDIILEQALKLACSAPMEILTESCKIIPILEELSIKGSKIALSDVGVAAVACQAAIQGGALNVYVNTRLMKDKEYAYATEKKVAEICREFIPKCQSVYNTVEEYLIAK